MSENKTTGEEKEDILDGSFEIITTDGKTIHYNGTIKKRGNVISFEDDEGETTTIPNVKELRETPFSLCLGK